MRRTANRILTGLIVMVFGLIPLGNAQQNLITIKGSVLESGTEKPIADVQVIVRGLPNARAATTDSGGHFSISEVPSGVHPIQLQRDGYLQADDRPAAIFDFNANSEMKLFLVRGAAVSGRILDPSGSPVAKAVITVSRTTYVEGERVLSNVPSSQRNIVTDDRGQYRAFWFTPGEYYISAELRPVASQQAIKNVSFVPTFYPGTAEWSEARPFVLRAGEDLSSLDFVMQVQTKPSKRVIGVIGVPPELGTSVVASGLYLIPLDIPTSLSNPPLLAVSNGAIPDFPSNFRRFTISDVPYGLYNLVAIATGGNNKYFASIPIEVGTQDMGFPQYFVEAGSDLKIRPAVSGVQAIPADFNSVAMRLLPTEFGISPTVTPPSTIRRGPDGAFTFTKLPRARYRIVVSGLPIDAYVADIQEGGISIFRGGVIPIAAAGSSLNIDMILGQHGGTIRGAISDFDNALASQVTVVLAPETSFRLNELLYKKVSVSDSGQFEIRGVAPGNYSLFAISNLPPGAEQSAEYMKKKEAFGVALQVSDEITLNGIELPLAQSQP